MALLGDATRLGSGESDLSIVGEIDLSNRADFELRLRQIERHDDSRDVLVDMSEVTFMDSSGVHALLNATAALGNQGCIRLRDPSAIVCRVLELTVPSLLVRE